MQSSEEGKKTKKRAADKKKDDPGHAREYNQLLKEISEQRVRDMKQARGWKTLDSSESANQWKRDRQAGMYAPPDPDEKNPDSLNDDTLPNVCREDRAPSPSEEDDPET